MEKEIFRLRTAKEGTCGYGFRFVKKEYVKSKEGTLYTLYHEKTKAELLYFDRPDENKTFAIGFQTLPEDDTGVFHILEHSVLNGSKKFPVKEPFVSMLQSSMQTYLNAMTFSDKTLYPVSSRNEQDFFHLMMVYLDAVFCPAIYERPEIFMQEGWHYEFEDTNKEGEVYYNGVVFSEMKGAYADVDRLMSDATDRLLFPDTSYGYSSGGHPEHITDLSYEQFLAAHKRFYHPSNAKIFLDGRMDVDAVLKYIDEEYLSKYEYQKPDFEFQLQIPKPAEHTIYYEAREGELVHMTISKILGSCKETEKIYAAKILADYLADSNEAPLKRAFLEAGLAQDIEIEVNGDVYQPSMILLVRNMTPENFERVKTFLPESINAILQNGLNQEALKASLERFAFTNKEISQPYGLELAIRAWELWLYGENPLTHIENEGIFEALRKKINTEYFADLLAELFLHPEDKSYLYVFPSLTKGEEDAKREKDKITSIMASWDGVKLQQVQKDFVRMQTWQQSTDSEEALKTLPHLNLKDVPEEMVQTETKLRMIGDTKALQVKTVTNGIVYLNLFFDISDFSEEELCMMNVLASFLGELGTKQYSAEELQTKIKGTMGDLSAKIKLIAEQGNLQECKPYLLVSASMLEENVSEALQLLEELFVNGRYEETDRIYEILLQTEYYMKQSLIGAGHLYAINRALSECSVEGALAELLEGESFLAWFSEFLKTFLEKAETYSHTFSNLAAKTFAKNRLFLGYSGKIEDEPMEKLLSALTENEIGEYRCNPIRRNTQNVIPIPGEVGFSALAHNLYALGGEFSGSCAVLYSLLSFGYLWNVIRVKGGAYGTGMLIRLNGDILCYSYRDPNLKNSKDAYQGLADFLSDFLEKKMPLENTIIGAVNTIDPLLDPEELCNQECVRYLKGITPQKIAKIRKEILQTKPKDLEKLLEVLRKYLEVGRFCAVGDID